MNKKLKILYIYNSQFVEYIFELKLFLKKQNSSLHISLQNKLFTKKLKRKFKKPIINLILINMPRKSHVLF